MPTVVQPGLGAIAEDFDGFLVDQFGVLHDAVKPFPGAVDCLRRLRAAGKPVVLLSNSGKRAAQNRERLLAIGFPPELYTGLVTSGEATHAALADGRFADLGRRCFLIAAPGDTAMVDDLALDLVDDAGAADFVLLASFSDRRDPMGEFGPQLADWRRRSLQIICANPDLNGFFGDAIAPSPGALARDYAALGGTVHAIGKPHAPIFAAALAALPAAARGRVAIVGDSLDHDIAGGAAAGLTTVLVADGVHRTAFPRPWDDARALPALDGLVAGARPDVLLHRFRW